MKRNRRVFVVGIDGATFRVILPMISNGKLLNLKMLIESGASGNLISTIPTLSPVAWTSITTGVNPMKHGILDFIAFDKQKKSFVLFDSSRRHVKPLWSILSEFGYKTCVINVPMTYPADRVNGFMISGLGTPPGGENLAYPRDTYDEMVRELGNYRIDIDASMDRVDFDEMIQSMRSTMDSRIRAMNFLLNKEYWDFFMIVFTVTDRAQHFFWSFMDSSHQKYNVKMATKYGDIIYEMYEKVDSAIGQILKHMEDDDYLILVSDHGFGPLHKGFSMSRWLWENNYLTVRRHPRTNAPLNLFKMMKRLIPLKIRYFVRKNIFKDKGYHRAILSYMDGIVWEKTRVFCHKMFEATFMYLNDAILKDRYQVDDLKKEITLKLKEIRDPSTGVNIFQDIIDGNNLFKGDAPYIPDLVIVPSENYDIYFDLYDFQNRPLFQDNTPWSGKHDPEGIFVIYGPDVKRGEEIEGVHVVDVAPTIYFLYRIPVYRDIDGRVIKECFTEEFLKRSPILVNNTDIMVEKGDESSLSVEESEAISKKLKELGYL